MKDTMIHHTTPNGISIDYQSEFMENYVPESKIDFASGIQSVCLSGDKAALFYINKEGRFCVLLPAGYTGGEWQNVFLSPEECRATAFALCYTEQTQTLRICYARQSKNGSELLITREIKADHFVILASGVPGFENVEVPEKDREIDHISCDLRGVLYSTKKAGTDAKYAYLMYGERPQPYTLPENTNRVQQIEVGSAYGDFGVFILYDMPGNRRTFLFKSFPEPGESEISQERIEVKADGRTVQLECFDLIKDQYGNDIIFMGGEGIYRASAPDAPRETIADKSFRCSRLTVAANEGVQTVWALNPQKQALYYLTDDFLQQHRSGEAGQPKWTLPLAMYKSLQDFTAIKGTGLINQLFLFDQQTGLVHLGQDATSRNWRETILSVSDLKQFLSIASYTLDIYISGDQWLKDGQTVVELSAAESLPVYVNNRKLFLSPDFPLHIDAASYYSVIIPADSIAVPEIRLSCPGWQETVSIDPTGKVRQQLKDKIKSGRDLAEARKKDGSPLVKEKFDQRTLDQVAAAFSKAAASSAPDAASPKPLPSLVTVGGGNFVVETGNAAGDFFYSIRKGFEAVSGFVIEAVKNGIQFVLEIGDKVVKWIVETARDVMNFIEQVWAKIKVAFKDLVDFLAFLFDWDDILETKEALKLTTNRLIDQMRPAVVSGQEFVIAKIKELKIQATKFLGLADEQTFNQDFAGLANQSGQLSQNKPDTRVNWVGSKQEVIFGARSLDAQDINPQKLNELSGANKDPALKDIVELLFDFIKGNINLGQFLKKAARILVDMTFKFIEEFAREIFDLILAAIDLFKNFMNAGIDIPLISGIYRKISGADLSILDAICLLVAIPTTIVYKIAYNTAPFTQLPKQDFAARVAFSLT